MATHSSLRTGLFAAIGFTALVHAGDIQLDGVLLDTHGKPVSGVVVSLDAYGLSDTSDAQGKWSLESPLANLAGSPSFSNPRWNGRTLRLSLENPSLVEVDVFDARGARMGGLDRTRLEAGEHDLNIPRSGSAGTIQWLRLSVDGRMQILSNGIDPRQNASGSTETARRSMAESNANLVFSFQGRIISSQKLSSLHQTAIAFPLREVRIRAKAIADTAVRLDSLLLHHLDDGDLAGMRRIRLRFDPRDSSCFGSFYLPALANPSARRAIAWIQIMANGGRRVGLSDTTAFPIDADTLHFGSAFGLGNVLPRGEITGDSIHLVNIESKLGLILNRRGLGIRQYEWDAGDGKGFQVGDASKSMKWLEGLHTVVKSRVTDHDGNQAVFCKPIFVISRDTIVGLADRTVVAGVDACFNLKIYDKEGLVRTIFDFGDGARDSVTASGTDISGHHTYPVVPPIAGEASHTYTLTVTTVDRRGTRRSQTARITVLSPLTSIVVMNTVGEIGTALTLRARLLNRDTIAKVEWDVDGSGFRTGGADTTIQLPNQPTTNYPVLVRATDTRGQVYAVDTVHVRALQATRITDARDGQQYRIVTIGTQTWMAQNLNYRQTIGAKDTFGMCMDRDAAGCAKYGRLYSWSQAMGVDSIYNRKVWPGTTAKRQGICPQGWHVPTQAQWEVLVKTAGGIDFAGERLKATVDWSDGYNGWIGTDSFWFSAYPNTPYTIEEGRVAFGEGAYWWTSSQETDPQYENFTVDYRVFYDASQIYYSATEKTGFESLRCLKD